MTESELKAIEDRVARASPPPWRHTVLDLPENNHNLVIEFDQGGRVTKDMWDMGFDDVEFLAHAREDIPALLAEVRRLKEKCNDQS